MVTMREFLSSALFFRKHDPPPPPRRVKLLLNKNSKAIPVYYMTIVGFYVKIKTYT